MGSCTDAGGSMQSENDRIGLERVRSVEDFRSRRSELDDKFRRRCQLGLLASQCLYP